jgi:thioredoxin reductase
MSIRSGEGAGEENALSRNLRGLERGAKERWSCGLLVVGAGPAGAAAFEAARGLGVEGVVLDSRIDRGSPRPVSVREGRLMVAEDGYVREVEARSVILATGAGKSGEPQIAIAKALGCRSFYDRSLRYERLLLDAEGGTSVPGVFAAGHAARIGSESDAMESCRLAGRAAAARLVESP